jgi:hypothetical protein
MVAYSEDDPESVRVASATSGREAGIIGKNRPDESATRSILKVVFTFVEKVPDPKNALEVVLA